MNERPCYLYLVTHRETGKSYVGISTRVTARWSHHKSQAFNPNSKCVSYFHKALAKYGPDAFEWKVIAKFRNSSLAGEAEKFSVWYGYGDYNLTKGGNGPGPLSDSHKAAIAKAKENWTPWNKGVPMSDDTRAKVSASNKGRVRSEEFRQKVSKGMTGKVRSPEHQEKLNEAQTGKRKSPEAIAKRTATRRANALAKGKKY